MKTERFKTQFCDSAYLFDLDVHLFLMYVSLQDHYILFCIIKHAHSYT
jgi:hypothetical protein